MIGASPRIVRQSFLAIVFAASTAAALAQSGVGVEVKEITDNRYSAGDFSGNLEIKLDLTGTGLERVAAARVVVKKAVDDQGNDLLGERKPPDFQMRDDSSGPLTVTLASPERAAKSIRLSGTVELFVSARDPNSKVKIDQALAKPDSTLNAKALKSEKIAIKLLSPATYEAEQAKNKLDDAKIEKMRAEAKKEGVSDKDFETMVELAKALQEMSGGPLPEGAVALAASKQAFDRVLKIRLLNKDGSEISVPSRSTSSFGDDALMVLEPSEPPPSDAAMELLLLTKKSTISVPFDVKGAALP